MQSETLKISGMTCGGCSSKISNALKALPGVDEVRVSLPNGDAIVQFDETLTSPDQLKSAVEKAGYRVSDAAQVRPGKAGCCG
ncbi:heavy-metal-associated domain-containing protein [Pseudoduganella sp. UC29_106]|uniref:heavy-metal-associated domain-containing protein n=1 Tax=Pseudoduganella sp. UC29_106 TaxID=3374553 RepID=UPI0037570889